MTWHRNDVRGSRRWNAPLVPPGHHLHRGQPQASQDATQATDNMSAATVASRRVSAGELLGPDAPRRRSPARAAAVGCGSGANRPRSNAWAQHPRASSVRASASSTNTSVSTSDGAGTNPVPPAAAAASPGRGLTENKHSTDVESPPAHPRVCMCTFKSASMSQCRSSACSLVTLLPGTASGFTQRGDGGYDYSSDLAELTDPEAGPRVDGMGFAPEEVRCHTPLCPLRPHRYLAPSRPRLGPCTGCQWFQRQNQSWELRRLAVGRPVIHKFFLSNDAMLSTLFPPLESCSS